MRILMFAICSLFLYSATAGVEELQLDELEGIVPSFLIDQTGFSDDSRLILESIPQDLVPLLPVYQSGALGKKTYVGGVVDDRYLEKLSRVQVESLKNRIRELRTQEGLGFYPVVNNGRLYAIRRDYAVSYGSSTSLGLSFTLGGSNMVNFGSSLKVGLHLDFGSTVQLGKMSGINIGSSFQKIIDDWTIGLGEDESKLVIEQAAAITPLLLSYYNKDRTQLLDEAGSPLPLLPAQKLDAHTEELTKPELALSKSHTPEWVKVAKELPKNLPKEIAWKKDIASQVQSQKIVSNQKYQKLIQEICDRLAVSYQVPAEIWPKCRIASTLTPNAWAYPGGDIFITAGLLGILSEIDSVALVLGHEIGHVVGRHVSKRTKSTKTVNYAASFISSAVNLGVTAFSLGGGFGYLGNVSFLTWYPQAVGSSVVTGYAAGKGLEIAMFAPLAGLMLQSREHESQADRLGQEAAYASGADLTKMNQGWEEFVQYFDTYAPKKLNLKQRLLLDHPESHDRLESFEERAPKIEAILRPTFEANSWDQKSREEYEKLHGIFKPYSESFGRDLKRQLEAQTSKRDLKRKKAIHVIQTMTGPHSECIKHALGGY